MGVFFHILSTGGGAGASRVTRYIAERDRDLAREGPGTRPLFSEDREGLSYRKADRILDPEGGHPEKNDLIHFSVMIEEEEFDQLGANEKEKQEHFRNVIREGMRGMAEELNVEKLTWAAGIHRNSRNPHAHIVIRKDALERNTGREKRIGRIRKALLPHKQIENGRKTIAPGKIGERFVTALEKQQSLYLGRENEQQRAGELWDQLVRLMQERRESNPRRDTAGETRAGARQLEVDAQSQSPSAVSGWQSRESTLKEIAASWDLNFRVVEDRLQDYRLALGKQLEFSIRLAFTQVWYDRAVEHGEAYRFNVLDQSIAAERKISEFDVRRRAAARATRTSQGDYALRNQTIDADLDRHSDTLQQLSEAREAKITALQKDIAYLGGRLSKADKAVVAVWQGPNEQNGTPLLSRRTLSELQAQALKLNLPDEVSELEELRVALALEHGAPLRTETEISKLVAELNVARADFLAKDRRWENFEASVHLGVYEVQDERWSLGTLDKQIARRTEDSKLIPDRAARLDLRSLARLNYSSSERQQAVADVEHLTYVRAEIVREIERRREPLIEDRDRAQRMVETLEHAYGSEQRARHGKDMPEPTYEPHQMRALEGSAEILRDAQLLREVHEWEKTTGQRDDGFDWQSRAAAREITSSLAVAETDERLQHFLESKRVASLHVGNHRTATLREVEARTVTEYLARAIETGAQRDHRHGVNLAAREHHAHLVDDHDKARLYHETVRELALETDERKPKFTDKEKINLEIYAERLNNDAERERYLELARGEGHSPELEASMVHGR
jgi:hypothetical protein